MIDFIKQYYNEEEHDGFTFGFTKNLKLEIVSFKYSDIDHPIHPPRDLGFKYHVLTYIETGYQQYSDLELYTAILGEPIDFVNRLIKNKVSGMICKTSEVSIKPIEAVYNSMLKGVSHVCEI